MPMYGERLAAAITVAVTTAIRWRAALPSRRALQQVPPQPDGAGISLTTAATTTAGMATATATPTAATSPDGRRCFRATTAATVLATITGLMPLADTLDTTVPMLLAIIPATTA